MIRPDYRQVKHSNELYHYGMPRRSGRYPYGSGERPYQSKERRKIKKPNLFKILAMTVPVVGTGVSGFGVASLINMGVNPVALGIPIAIGASNVLLGRRLYKVLNEEKLDNKNIKRGMSNFDLIMRDQTNLQMQIMNQETIFRNQNIVNQINYQTQMNSMLGMF